MVHQLQMGWAKCLTDPKHLISGLDIRGSGSLLWPEKPRDAAAGQPVDGKPRIQNG